MSDGERLLGPFSAALDLVAAHFPCLLAPKGKELFPVITVKAPSVHESACSRTQDNARAMRITLIQETIRDQIMVRVSFKDPWIEEGQTVYGQGRI